MIQLYILSVLSIGLSGFVLFTDKEESAGEKQKLFNNATFFLVLGIITIATGILKLLSPTGRVIFFGDFIPAVTGIFAGFVMIFGIYKKEISTDATIPTSMEIVALSILRFKKSLGLAFVVIALIHFFFAEVLFF